MVFENTPTAFDRILLAVIGRVVCQAYGKIGLAHKLYNPLHELGTPTMVFGAIVQVDDQHRDMGKAVLDCLPPLQ